MSKVAVELKKESFGSAAALAQSVKPTIGSASPARLCGCGCDAEKIEAIHAYLHDHFPQYALRDLHAPRERIEGGQMTVRDEQHVVRITRPGVLPYYIIVLAGFLELSADQVRDHLRHWAVADVVRRCRVAIMSTEGPSPL